MLKSLTIKNFRSLEDLQVEKLGRVNLIVGKNNSGKSSVLEALRIYAGNANQELLESIAQSHDEKCFLDKDAKQGIEGSMPYEWLFTGRIFPKDDLPIVIGEVDNNKVLKIYHVYKVEKEYIVTDTEGNKETIKGSSLYTNIVIPAGSGYPVPGMASPIHPCSLDSGNPCRNDGLEKQLCITARIKGPDSISNLELVKDSQILGEGLLIKKNGNAVSIDFNVISSDFRRFVKIENALPCSVIPTQLLTTNELANDWDSIALTELENTVKDAMKIILPEFENITFVNESSYAESKSIRRIAKVKIKGLPRPVPLNSLGDGMLRILQIALKLVTAKGGFLLIDEFENGLHYSVQEKVWTLLFEVSKKLDIQVFATTHSWDCIESFAKVAVDKKDINGVLFRLGTSIRTRDKGRIIATVFEEEPLFTITQSGVEVR